MTAIDLKFGIPDLEMPRVGGGVVNPSDFAGHQLVVVFCPTPPNAATRELADYSSHASELCDNDAWAIGICDNESAASIAARQTCFSVATDRDGRAWDAFRKLARHVADDYRRESGAVFLFGRGGSLQRSWTGSGHASEVMRELNQRA